MSEERIADALKALREADDGQEAGPGVEARLMVAFRKHRAGRVWKRAGAVVTMVTAAAAVTVMIVDRPQAEAIRPAQPRVVTRPEFAPEPAEVPARPRLAPRKAPRRQEPPVREIATEFFPLLDVQ